MSRQQLWSAMTLVAALLLSGCLGVTSPVGPEPVDAPVAAATESVGASDEASGEAPVSDSSGRSGVALSGEVYGEGVSLAQSVAISEILDNVDAYAGERVRVEGLITAVCEHRGCWIDLAGDREFETLRVKVEDGVIVFPMEVRGKYAVAEGVVTKLGSGQPCGEGSGEPCGEGEGQHEGEGAGAGGQGEHAAAEGMVVRLDATGAVIRDQQ